MLYILHFLMTAIRKTTLQVVYFQYFTTLTTDLCTSNDRFGFIDIYHTLRGSNQYSEFGLSFFVSSASALAS
jgi:hypothetical protein